MKTIIVAYDPNDMSRAGTTCEVTDEEARQLVREGRARYVPEPEAPAGAAPQPATVEQPELPTPDGGEPDTSAGEQSAAKASRAAKGSA